MLLTAPPNQTTPSFATPAKEATATAHDGTASLQSIVANLADTMDAAIDEISDINANTQLLSLNARIEAARAGTYGAAFAVVAQEMQSLSGKTAEIAADLSNRSRHTIENLMDLIGSNIRGTRLSDLALMNIDLVDRNLYERTCDVRWWATDSSLVDALTDQTTESYAYASKRLGVILNAYTVYHDLVLCDTEGRIVANGRPEKFDSRGHSVASAGWFRQAMSSLSGDEYGFETAHHSALVDQRSVLIYSCGVRVGGDANGALLGTLGILFNWEDFAQTIMQEVPLSETERSSTRCLLSDGQGNILADSWGKQLQERLPMKVVDELFDQKKDYVMTNYNGRPCCIAHAQAPGFETYSTGWHSVILQEVESHHAND